jgi:hypothetical protein
VYAQIKAIAAAAESVSQEGKTLVVDRSRLVEACALKSEKSIGISP